MEDSVRDLLLEEARARHKFELERYAQLNGRAGVYLVVVGLSVGPLGRFLDKPPRLDFDFTSVFFVASVLVTLGAMLGAAVLVGVALRGRDILHSTRPSGWLTHFQDNLDPHYSSERDRLPHGFIREDAAHRQLLVEMLAGFSKSIDHNFQVNTTRAKWLYQASRLLPIGLVALIACLVSYLCLAPKPPSPDAVTAVRLVAPVAVDCDARTAVTTGGAEPTPAPIAQPTAEPTGTTDTNSE